MRGFSRGWWVVVCAGLAFGCGEADAPDRCAGRVEVRSQSDIARLEGCSRIDGDLWITESRLASLAGLERLESVRYLVIGANAELESLQGLGLRSVEGVTLWNNPVLAELEPLGAIEELPALALLEQGVLDPSALERVRTAELSRVSSDGEQ